MGLSDEDYDRFWVALHLIDRPTFLNVAASQSVRMG
jgi:hypothetical protein